MIEKLVIAHVCVGSAFFLLNFALNELLASKMRQTYQQQGGLHFALTLIGFAVVMIIGWPYVVFKRDQSA